MPSNLLKTSGLLAMLLAGTCHLGICQISDPGSELNSVLSNETGGRLKLNFEFRSREEARTGNGFGKSVDLDNILLRTRIGATFRITDWWKVSATGQDSRAPFYGKVSPATIRDTMDLLEGYVDLFGNHDTGFSAMFGRKVMSYGDGRLIGTPDWTNLSRSYDGAHVSYKFRKSELQVLMVSPVKILSDAFNHPDLGDRVTGTYDTFHDLIPGSFFVGSVFDGYFLRHDQNKIGGFTAPGTVATETVGGRTALTLPYGFKFKAEGMRQGGHYGVKDHSASAWVATLSRPVIGGRIPVEISSEYKFASGTKTPGPTKDGTFDQLYPSNHDRFGEADLFGWKNIKDLQVLGKIQLTKRFSANLMYNDWWLASRYDSLYNSSGSSIALSSKGTAGTHVGQEADAFGVYKIGSTKFGLGFAHVFVGDFLKATTPGVNTRYLYLFQSYSF